MKKETAKIPKMSGRMYFEKALANLEKKEECYATFGRNNSMLTKWICHRM